MWKRRQRFWMTPGTYRLPNTTGLTHTWTHRKCDTTQRSQHRDEGINTSPTPAKRPSSIDGCWERGHQFLRWSVTGLPTTLQGRPQARDSWSKHNGLHIVCEPSFSFCLIYFLFVYLLLFLFFVVFPNFWSSFLPSFLFFGERKRERERDHKVSGKNIGRVVGGERKWSTYITWQKFKK